MLASYIDNWLFLLLVAIAMLFRWLMAAANKASKDSNRDEPESTPPPTARSVDDSPWRTQTPPTASPAQTDEERIRRFLEALGQPQGSKPPPPVTPRKMDAARAAAEARHRLEQARRMAQPKTKTFQPGTPLPPLTTFPPPVPLETSAAPVAAKSQTAFDVQEGSTPAQLARTLPPLPEPTAATRERGTIKALLRSRSGLRDAIILREIFGPPRSLQSLELISL